MNKQDFLQGRTNALAQELGGMSLARVALEAHDCGASVAALHLLQVWLCRDLSDAECVAMRDAAHRLGVDLQAFDEAQIEKAKNHA